MILSSRGLRSIFWIPVKGKQSVKIIAKSETTFRFKARKTISVDGCRPIVWNPKDPYFSDASYNRDSIKKNSYNIISTYQICIKQILTIKLRYKYIITTVNALSMSSLSIQMSSRDERQLRYEDLKDVMSVCNRLILFFLSGFHA